MFDTFELGEIAVFNNFRVYEMGAGLRLERGEGIVAVNCITNSSATARVLARCVCTVYILEVCHRHHIRESLHVPEPAKFALSSSVSRLTTRPCSSSTTRNSPGFE